jgi:hypothetical protein
MVDDVERVNALVQQDRQVMVTETEDKFDISCESAYSIIHEGLGYHEICARCVPKEFTNEHKQAHVEMCMQFLQQYCEEGEAFLQK